MPIYKTRQSCYGYGYCIGIMHCDFSAPFIPGDVTNASTYDYPVLYETVPGASSDRIMAGDPELTREIVAAAKRLAKQGVKGLTGDSGFLLHYQDAITSTVDIPVFSSSLLQIPLISIFLGRQQAIGIICADSVMLAPELLKSKGLINDSRLIVGGMQDEPQFSESIYSGAVILDSDAIESEVVARALRMQKADPEIGAFVLECSMLPPYSKAVQDATKLPVYDFVTMIDYFKKVTHRSGFTGYY